MIIIIRNLLIVKDTILLQNLHFGECHSLKANEDLVASFLSALNILSKDIFGSSIIHINYEDFFLYFYKDPDYSNTFFILFTDSYEEPKAMNYRISQIALIFKEKYPRILKNFKGFTSGFNNFKKTLIEMHVTQDNCGKHTDCNDCPENTKRSKIFDIFKEKRERFLAFSQEVIPV